MRQGFRINVLSHCWITKAFLPKMIDANRGHLVTVSSTAGYAAMAGLADYSAATFALVRKLAQCPRAGPCAITASASAPTQTVIRARRPARRHRGTHLRTSSTLACLAPPQVGFSESLRAELRRRNKTGVTVSCVSPRLVSAEPAPFSLVAPSTWPHYAGLGGVTAEYAPPHACGVPTHRTLSPRTHTCIHTCGCVCACV